jgi:predicted transcriptional regulator
MLHVKGSQPKRIRISVPLTPEEMAALHEIASTSDRSLSWVAARAIRLYIADSQEGSRSIAGSGTADAATPPK